MPIPLLAGLGAASSLLGGLFGGKKKQTTETDQSSNYYGNSWQDILFNPEGLATYAGLQPTAGGVLMDLMQRPWESGYFQHALTKASEGIGQRAQSAYGNLLNPALTGGGGAGSIANPNAFMASQMNMIGRGASKERNDALVNLLLGSAQLRANAAQTAANYRPLQTGQVGHTSGASQGHSTSTTTGSSGSLLSNLLSAGGNLGMLGGALLGGQSYQPPPLNVPNQNLLQYPRDPWQP